MMGTSVVYTNPSFFTELEEGDAIIVLGNFNDDVSATKDQTIRV